MENTTQNQLEVTKIECSMNQEIRCFFSLRKLKSDFSLLQINFMFKDRSGKRIKFRRSTGLKIKAAEWDSFRKAPIAEYAMSNEQWYHRFTELKTLYNRIRSTFIEENRPLNKKSFTEWFDVHTQHLLAPETVQEVNESPVHLDEFILWTIANEKNLPHHKKKGYGTLKQYMKTYNKLHKYYLAKGVRIALSSARIKDVDDLVFWFTEQKQSNGKYYARNTIKDLEKWVVALLNKALASGMKLPNWNPHIRSGRVPAAEADNIHFDLFDFQRLVQYQPKNEKEKKVQTWSVIAYCSGLRISDWPRFYKLLSQKETPSLGEVVTTLKTKRGDFRYVQLRPKKTSQGGRGRVAGIPILKPVEQIISRNGLCAPITGQKMNEYMKELFVNVGISELYTHRTIIKYDEERAITLPKGKFATTKSVGRSSFITLFHGHVPKEILSKITGHAVGTGTGAYDTYIRDLKLNKNAKAFIELAGQAQDEGEFSIVERNGEEIKVEIELV